MFRCYNTDITKNKTDPAKGSTPKVGGSTLKTEYSPIAPRVDNVGTDKGKAEIMVAKEGG